MNGRLAGGSARSRDGHSTCVTGGNSSHIRNRVTEFRVDEVVTKWDTAGAPKVSEPQVTALQNDPDSQRDQGNEAGAGTTIAISPLSVCLQEDPGAMSQTSRLRRWSIDALLTVGALLTVLAVLIGFDARVREQVSDQISGRRAASELVYASSGVRDLATTIIQVARDQSEEHASLMILAVAASILVLFMLRT
jgi:hypothetical protein